MTQGRILGRELATSQKMLTAQIGHGQVRPFITPPCPRCGTPLSDSDGNPRWEIVGKLTFVCLGGCPVPARRRTAARA